MFDYRRVVGIQPEASLESHSLVPGPYLAVFLYIADPAHNQGLTSTCYILIVYLYYILFAICYLYTYIHTLLIITQSVSMHAYLLYT